MKHQRAIVLAAAVFRLAVSLALAAQSQDRFTLKSANGIALSEFKGYDEWEVIAASQAADGIKVIVGNHRTIEVEFVDAGVEAFAFTFG